ncbi:MULTISPECIES: type II secretion system protein [unclassified Herbaspirillum]|uniref:type II secretion system protein n=1 Tax=unclassified Herbaspirillum TaxID=2624150 RepID=UPI00116D8727|nr:MULTISPECIES: type II secretion system protein [unclassified Herbaspirillum]MBB5390551.1 type II secretory pathway pseudopilin PulG [Herbaspirillum sp. SJZ102]TQK08961.1 general secretion pathway protein G [Herbaspirillum sp. SJZ130]TQK14352.1 general secretion pathway protein G [Herbaspirillum sp. SJZ106]TWC66631.1 general secretion pathway protein G [Herbaspirillum sp. SJZ099]
MIELLVTITLLSLLATAAMPLREVARQRAKESELRSALMTIRSAIDAYKHASDAGRIERSIDDSGYPPTLRTLVEGVPDKQAANGGTLYFLRRMPADPFCECSGKEAEDTWQTRSYDSSPEAFSSGDDVFDIRSSSHKEGLDGTPYNEW